MALINTETLLIEQTSNNITQDKDKNEGFIAELHTEN